MSAFLLNSIGLVSFDISFCLHFLQPYLYTLVVTLKDQTGRVVDCESCPVGFRKVSKAHKQLLVNGHAVVIRGVNRHEHHPQVGKTNIESCMVKVLLVSLSIYDGQTARCFHFSDTNDCCAYRTWS